MIRTLQKAKDSPGCSLQDMMNLFTKENPQHGIKRLDEFFKNLIEKLIERGNVADRARAGPPLKLDEGKVEECIKLFKQGAVTEDGSWYGYTSIEHAVTECQGIREIVSKSGVALETLWRRMKATQVRLHGRSFNKITIHVRPPLTDEVKAERLRIAAEWAEYQQDDLERFFWIDEKQLYVHNTCYKCYADDDARSRIVESHQVLGKKKKLKYIACVNAIVGPVYMGFLSGTSDYESGFKVRRTVVPSTRHKHPPMPCQPVMPGKFNHG
jgi:hypothetical protein